MRHRHSSKDKAPDQNSTFRMEYISLLMDIMVLIFPFSFHIPVPISVLPLLSVSFLERCHHSKALIYQYHHQSHHHLAVQQEAFHKTFDLVIFSSILPRLLPSHDQ